jgi:Holliday junction resolvase RusA-like endonuclease
MVEGLPKADKSYGFDMNDESTFRVVIPGPPQSWQRPRFAGRSRRVYSPSSLEVWYDAAALAIWPLWSKSTPLSGPLRIAVDAVTARPKSLPAALKSCGWSAARWRATPGRVARPTTPDVDNFAKAALDALQGDPAKMTTGRSSSSSPGNGTPPKAKARR